MPTARQKHDARRRGAAPLTKPFVFTYRCPPELIGPLTEARFALREPTRSGLVTKAITEYLRKHGFVDP